MERRVSGVPPEADSGFSNKKFQITKHKYQMVRQAVRQAHGPEQSRRTHHLTTLSQPVESLKVERVEGQITMTEIQIPK
jgi:hypothetical protein